MWFTIPFALATSMGLAALSLELPISSDEAGAGLVPPAAAMALLGKGGAIAIAMMLFMAITSTGSAELIAVSSLVSYDIYREFFPDCTGEDIIRVSRYFIVGFGLFMGVFAVVLHQIGLGLGWVYLFMGIVIGSAVPPIWFCLTSPNLPWFGAVASAFIGQASAFICWLVTASSMYEVTVDGLGKNEPMLAGNVAALGVSTLSCLVFGFVAPQNYDWESMKNIPLVDADDKSGLDEEDYTDEKLEEASTWIARYGYGVTFILIVLWPLLSIPAGTFSKAYFGFWVQVAIFWGVAATIGIIGLPIYESIDDIRAVLYGMFGMACCAPAVAAAGTPATPGTPGTNVELDGKGTESNGELKEVNLNVDVHTGGDERNCARTC